MPLGEAGQKLVVAERAGGARHARKGLESDAVMEGKGAHIIGVGQDALGDQHAVGTGAGLRRAQFGGGELRRRHHVAQAVDFRAGREPAANPCRVEIGSRGAPGLRSLDSRPARLWPKP